MSEAPSFILACDIGGTHITSAIVNTQNWEILSYTLTRTHINSSSDAKSIFQGWANNIIILVYQCQVLLTMIMEFL